MKIEAQNYILELTYSELWTLAFNVKASLESTIKNYWVNHQERWQENEKARLETINKLFLALGRPDIYDKIFVTAKEVFEKHNESKVNIAEGKL